MNESVKNLISAGILAAASLSEAIDTVYLDIKETDGMGIIDDATRSELLLLSDALHTLLRTVAPRKGENILN